MKRYYRAVTYDVCDHHHLYEDMNEYSLDSTGDINQQIRELAKKDVAPLVKLYEADTSDFKELRFYKEYKFKEYECNCHQ